jgi:uncharacterized protein
MGAMDDIATLLEHVKAIAVVGLSTMPWKSAHAIPAHLQACGYRVIPVHPTAEEILGEPAYPRLADVPDEVDLVNVFRPSAEAADVVRQAADAGMPAVWLQSGIRSAEARRIAEDAGMGYVEDNCLGVVVSRLGLRPC